MNSRDLKRLAFFWTISFLAAVTGYYLLWWIMPGHHVFGTWFRMYSYHEQYPLPYILIPCLLYGLIANLSLGKFVRRRLLSQLFVTLFIAALTILLSTPFGGMLWTFHDMQAGFFPDHWRHALLVDGAKQGLMTGWLIIALSFPYNLLGLIVCFFLTRASFRLFPD